MNRLTLRYVNVASEEQFHHVALAMIALKQSGLLTAPTAINKDRNGHLNGNIIKKDSAIMKTLLSNLSREAKTPTNSQEELALWRDLQLFELLGFRSQEFRMKLNSLLLRILEKKQPLPSVIGLLLSVVAEDELPDNLVKIIQLLSEQLELLDLDLTFLDGLEKFVSRLPTYT